MSVAIKKYYNHGERGEHECTGKRLFTTNELESTRIISESNLESHWKEDANN